ncbi:hypothetical protein HMPREF9163_00171 [Selenomonas sp. oral taxon 138 str. F0429]|nr:hypothetical protein HMPREF9163_00171 [Selenomonas sp. oral taxon 138 str. F0429]
MKNQKFFQLSNVTLCPIIMNRLFQIHEHQRIEEDEGWRWIAVL